MNPLNSVRGAITTGVVVALILMILIAPTGFQELGLARWLHILSGVMWIGLLWYFNVVQIPALGIAAADKGGPGGVHTMLCFDPTRGIDIRTKNQIYVLLRDLAEAGAAILLYTSELKEIQLVCDRVIVIFGGKVVAELDARDADEPRLLRAAYNLKADAELPEETIAEASSEGGREDAADEQAAASSPLPPSTVEAGAGSDAGTDR